MKEKFEGCLADKTLKDYSVEELLKAAKYSILYGDIKRTRESSLVLTKIDEALLWLSQCDYLAEEE